MPCHLGCSSEDRDLCVISTVTCQLLQATETLIHRVMEVASRKGEGFVTCSQLGEALLSVGLQISQQETEVGGRMRIQHTHSIFSHVSYYFVVRVCAPGFCFLGSHACNDYHRKLHSLLLAEFESSRDLGPLVILMHSVCVSFYVRCMYLSSCYPILVSESFDDADRQIFHADFGQWICQQWQGRYRCERVLRVDQDSAFRFGQ